MDALHSLRDDMDHFISSCVTQTKLATKTEKAIRYDLCLSEFLKSVKFLFPSWVESMKKNAEENESLENDEVIEARVQTEVQASEENKAGVKKVCSFLNAFKRVHFIIFLQTSTDAEEKTLLSPAGAIAESSSALSHSRDTADGSVPAFKTTEDNDMNESTSIVTQENTIEVPIEEQSHENESGEEQEKQKVAMQEAAVESDDDVADNDDDEEEEEEEEEGEEEEEQEEEHIPTISTDTFNNTAQLQKLDPKIATQKLESPAYYSDISKVTFLGEEIDLEELEQVCNTFLSLSSSYNMFYRKHLQLHLLMSRSVWFT